MMVNFKPEELQETAKAVGIKIKHNDKEKTLWFPKSQITNQRGWKLQGFVDIPDWLYDKKIDEAFF